MTRRRAECGVVAHSGDDPRVRYILASPGTSADEAATLIATAWEEWLQV